jgi:hypothetical protein
MPPDEPKYFKTINHEKNVLRFSETQQALVL